MRHPYASARPLITFLALSLALACAPQADPGHEQPGARAASIPPGDPGLLLGIMVDLGRDMSRLSDALWRHDLAVVAASATAIAHHPRVSAAELERVQTALGDSFPEFVEADQRVHHSAVRLAELATSEDLDGTLEGLADLQAGCVACHDAFRESLRTPMP